jgi:23S rRNA pseudouridine1911/1915/1917 synthase
MPRFTVSAAEAGRRADVVVASRLDVSRGIAQKYITGGYVTVSGSAVRKQQTLREGQVVECHLPAVAASVLAPEEVAYTLVYEDDWLLVVDKPAGIVVHPAPGHEHGTLVQGLLERGIAGGHERRPGIVHRLDKDTSGLLIVARTAPAYRSLVESMARRDIHRSYVALVRGSVPQEEAVIDVPIGRHVRDRKRISVHTASPRRAVTRFVVRERLAGFTLVDVALETGRTHQIRVHFAALGYPVAGDVHYGSRPRPQGLGRQFLHAAALAFPHPGDGRELAFESALPGDLETFLSRLRGVDGVVEDPC